jgi:predicted acyltransferase
MLVDIIKCYSDRVQKERLQSLDVFRGGTIAAMIMVNNQASNEAYPQLLHAQWHGWTFTDLVFPFFLWIVGIAITLSFAKRTELGGDRSRLLLHVVRRSAIIFGVGLLLNGFPYYNLATLRIPGVLQRIAICYLVGATIFLFTKTRGRILWCVGLLSAYWILMKMIPVPGCGAGSFTIDCNFERWIDGMVLSGHMYSRTRAWDPEGLVSTLPAITNVLFGIFAGQILRLPRSASEKASWLFFAGAGLTFTGLMLSTWIPINKSIWTSPYAVFTSGLAFTVFACCFWLVDVLEWRRFARPFVIYGLNALAVYVFSGLLARILGVIKVGEISIGRLVWEHGFARMGNPAAGSLLYSLCHVAVGWLFALWLYRRNWIVRA